MKKNLLIIFLLSAIIAKAQRTGTSVNGVVTDNKSGHTIEFASVSLVNAIDTTKLKSAITDKKGRFDFKDVMPDSYIIRCTFIGFDKTQTAAFTITDGQKNFSIGNIGLTIGSATLKDVVVTATNKPTLNTSIDRKTYNVEQDIMSKSGSVSDILKNIPSVEVDIEGQVSLRGSADVMILINGKPSPLMGKSRAEVLQHFARLFNQRVGQSSNEYRNSLN
jgi:hypothetical protein